MTFWESELRILDYDPSVLSHRVDAAHSTSTVQFQSDRTANTPMGTILKGLSLLLNQGVVLWHSVHRAIAGC